MTRAELEFYSHNVPAIRKALERIANALENQNQFVVNTIKGQNHKAAFEAEQAQDEAVDKAVDRILDNGIDFQVNKEDEELDTHHDYLHGLVQDLDNDAYHEFCNAHCLPASDTVAVSNYITDLDYDEVLGIISDLEAEYPFGGKSNDQANEDAIEESFTDTSEKDGVPYDDDYDLRCTARMYENELEHGHLSTKKEAILDYVTNEFGSQGARYTDIIKFAYYLGDSSGSKFNSTRDRGYYSLGMSGRGAYLIRGGKDFLVKGINKEGNERYFAHSFVESVTEYWKYI
jgi:hypothetical protein